MPKSLSLLCGLLKIGNRSFCFSRLHFVCLFVFKIVIKWYLAKVLWKLQGALKCVWVCMCCVCTTENPLSLCFSISFLRKIRLFKSHYAQLLSVPPKPLYSITSSKSEKGGESVYCGRQGLLFSYVHFICGALKSWVHMSHEIFYLFQLCKIQYMTWNLLDMTMSRFFDDQVKVLISLLIL